VKKARFFWRSTCTTCRNARDYLRSDLNAELDERDYAKQPLTADELRQLFANHDPRDFLNPKSPSFKARGLDAGKLTAEQAIALMVQEPRMIKRPITAVGKQLIAGFDKEALRKALA
jgi:Spx/MgsR family transcriptional regulator